MKKTVLMTIALTLLLSSSLHAAKEYIMFGGSAGWNQETKSPEAGFYGQYQFGVQLSRSFSFGFGTYIFSDFPVKVHDSASEYSNVFNLALGPAFSVRLDSSTSLTAVTGFDIMGLSASSRYTDDKSGTGFGSAVGFNFFPGGEDSSPENFGFVLGASFSLIFLTENPGRSVLSTRAFFGFTLSQPLLGCYFPDVYSFILDTALRPAPQHRPPRRR